MTEAFCCFILQSIKTTVNSFKNWKSKIISKLIVASENTAICRTVAQYILSRESGSPF